MKSKAEIRPERARVTEQTGPKRPSASVAQTRPPVPTGITELFLPNNQTLSQALKTAGMESESIGAQTLIYRPGLLAQALVRYLDRKNNIDESRTVTALIEEADRQGIIRWEDWISSAIDRAGIDSAPVGGAQFAELEPPLTDSGLVKSMAKDFLDYVYHDAGLKILQNTALKLVAQPGTSRTEFISQCSEAASQGRDDEIDKLQDKYEKKIDSLEDKITSEERELAEDQAELSGRKMEELATHAENVLGLFGGSRSSRRVSSSLTKRRMTSKAKADVEESMEEIDDLRAALVDMEKELKKEIEEIEERWTELASQIDETTLTAYKKDIREDLFGLAWIPFWRIEIDSKEQELPGYLPK